MPLLRALALAASVACGGGASTEPTPEAGSGVLIVANKREASVSLIDVGSGETLAKLPTGAGPHEVAVTSDGATAIVSNYGEQIGGNSLTVIDVRARRVVRTIDLGGYRRPHGIAILPGDQRAVVTAEASSAVLVVDLGRGVVERAIATGQAGSHMVVISPDGRRAYTADIGSGTVTSLDLEAGTKMLSAPVGAGAEGIGISPDGATVWVGSNDENTVTAFDAATLTPRRSVTASGVPIRVTVTPDGRHVLITNMAAGHLQAYHADGSPAFGIDLSPDGSGPASPIGTIVSPDSRYAFVATVALNQVAMIDLGERRVVRRLATGAGPDGLALAAGGER